MKSVMISIQPQWVEKIISGKKTIEVRKTKPNIDTPFKAYIYCTKGNAELPVERKINRELEDLCDGYEILYWANGKVIGEFICDKVYETTYFDKLANMYLWGYDYVRQETYLADKDMCAYGNGKILYGWHISNLKIYDKPKELSEFKKSCKERFKCLGCEKNIYCGGNCEGVLERPPQSWQYCQGVEE